MANKITEEDRAELSKKANAKNLSRQIEIGITHGVWHFLFLKNPSCNHQSLHEKHFPLSKGMLFGDKYIYPGEEPNCRCWYTCVIAGFDDDKENILQKIKRKTRKLLNWFLSN
jgi:hypothetical protein